jgi:hypothetical protein
MSFVGIASEEGDVKKDEATEIIQDYLNLLSKRNAPPFDAHEYILTIPINERLTKAREELQKEKERTSNNMDLKHSNTTETETKSKWADIQEEEEEEKTKQRKTKNTNLEMSWHYKLKGLSPTAKDFFIERFGDMEEGLSLNKRINNQSWMNYHSCQFLAECMLNLFNNEKKKEIEMTMIGDGAILLAIAMAEEGFQPSKMNWTSPSLSENGEELRQVALHLDSLQKEVSEYKGTERIKEKFKSFYESIIRSIKTSTSISGVDPLSVDTFDVKDPQQLADSKTNNQNKDTTKLKELISLCNSLLLSKEIQSDDKQRMTVARLRSLYCAIQRRIKHPRYLSSSSLNTKNWKLTDGTDFQPKPLGRIEESGFNSSLISSKTSLYVLEGSWTGSCVEWLQSLCNIRSAAECCANDISWFVWWEPQHGRWFFNPDKNPPRTTSEMLQHPFQGRDQTAYRLLQLIADKKEEVEDIFPLDWIARILMFGLDFKQLNLTNLIYSSQKGLHSNSTKKALPSELVDTHLFKEKEEKRERRHYYLNSMVSGGKRFWYYASCKSESDANSARQSFLLRVFTTHDVESRKFQPITITRMTGTTQMSFVRLFHFSNHKEELPVDHIPFIGSTLSTEYKRVYKFLHSILESEAWNRPSGPGNQPLEFSLKRTPFVSLHKVRLFIIRDIPTSMNGMSTTEENPNDIQLRVSGDMEFICQLVRALATDFMAKKDTIEICNGLISCLLDVVKHFRTHRFTYKSRFAYDRPVLAVEQERADEVRKDIFELASLSDYLFHKKETDYNKMIMYLLPFCLWVDSGFTDYSNEDEKKESSKGNYDGGQISNIRDENRLFNSTSDNIFAVQQKIRKHLKGIRIEASDQKITQGDNVEENADISASFLRWEFPASDSLDNLLQRYFNSKRWKRITSQGGNTLRNRFTASILIAYNQSVIQLAANNIPNNINLAADIMTDELSYQHTRQIVNVVRQMKQNMARYLHQSPSGDDLSLVKFPTNAEVFGTDKKDLLSLKIWEVGGRTGLTTFATCTLPRIQVMYELPSTSQKNTIFQYATLLQIKNVNAVTDRKQVADVPFDLMFHNISFFSSEDTQKGVHNIISECLEYVKSGKKEPRCATFALPARRTDLTFSDPALLGFSKKGIERPTEYDTTKKERVPFEKEDDVMKWITSSISAEDRSLFFEEDTNMIKGNGSRRLRIVLLPMNRITGVFVFMNYPLRDRIFEQCMMASLPAFYRQQLTFMVFPNQRVKPLPYSKIPPPPPLLRHERKERVYHEPPPQEPVEEYVHRRIELIRGSRGRSRGGARGRGRGRESASGHLYYRSHSRRCLSHHK